MDTNTPQWQQQGSTIGVVRDEKKLARPEQGVNCPRCNSTNTKFCYYNNYSLSQPRYFCKTCRRYWTEGGTLRNVPVGGGSRRKHKPSSSSSYNNISSSKKLDLNPPPKLDQTLNPKFSTPQIYNGIPTSSSSFHFQNPNLSFMDLLKTTTTPTSSSLFDSSNFPLIPNVHEINKPTNFTFSLDHEINPYGSLPLQSTVQDHDTIGTTFPFEEVPKPGFELELVRSGLQIDSNGNWNGVLPGASW